MKIGIIGAGNVGGALGKAWSWLGHEVFFGVRNPEDGRTEELLDGASAKASVCTVRQAAQAGSVILLATPWEVVKDALAAAGDLTGKILIDATNPLLPGLAGIAVGTTTSGGETIAEWAKGARVIKCFNTVGFNIMADAAFPQGEAAMFYCGGDEAAKKDVAQLAAELGFEALDAGPLAQCRVLEPFAMLWISLALKYGYGRDIGFLFMRRKPAQGTGQHRINLMQNNSRMEKNAKQPVVRISKGRFSGENYAEVKRLIDESATPLVPAIQALSGLLYYQAAVDSNTNTVVNVSIWENEHAAEQMATLAPMLAQRPILEAAGVQFDRIANYEPAWKVEGRWSFGK